MRPPKPKHHTKRCLREVKAHGPLFRQLVIDTKYPQDIPNHWPQMQCLGLPRFQHTVREPVSGLCFVGYADELSKTYTVLLAKRVCEHLARHGVDLRQVQWQTDNGSEFMDGAHHRGLPSTVRAWGCSHHYIPPKAYTWQSDVETMHRLVEDEFFDWETFAGVPEFWAKADTYWWYFNLGRPNRGKGWVTPLEIQCHRAPNLGPAIAAWRPLDLSALLRRSTITNRGDDLPSFLSLQCPTFTLSRRRGS